AGGGVDLLPGLRRLSHGQGAPGWHAAAESVRTERYRRPHGIWTELAGNRGASGDELDESWGGKRDSRAGGRDRSARAGCTRMDGLRSSDKLWRNGDTATSSGD